MCAKIRVLDDHTINKIAAGEVVENASSVVKELIENSLDAEAQEIVVEIQAGGRVLIRVSDDGWGMSQDDALLSLERHATSKIKDIDDLNSLTSMGFRGEALPSIASISKFSILTSEGGAGTFIRVEGGRLLGCDVAERSRGTTMEVKDLFYNLPVRKKFLTSPANDENEIIKVCLLEAIARPDIKFQLMINQKPALILQGTSPSSRIEDALGQTFIKDLLPLNRSEGGYHLGGYVGKPFSTRNNRTGQYLFLNGRPVNSPSISWAVKEAYSTHLSSGRFPIFVLWLTLPPEEMDINVHPQKKEVRLRQERVIKNLIFHAVHDALAFSRTPSSSWAIETMVPMPWNIDRDIEPDLPPLGAPQPTLNFEPQKIKAPQVLSTFKGFILTETPGKEGISLIDQHRAHARILFERLEKGSLKPLEKVALLIPLTLELSLSDANLLKEHLHDLRLMGFEIREFGANTFAIDAYPTLYANDSIENLLALYLKEVREYASSRLPENNLRQKQALKSSYLSINSEKCLSKEEASQLVATLFACEQPWESPLGKPTVIHLDPEHLTKPFLR